MPGLVRKSLDSPEETRPFEGGTGQLELVNMEGGVVGRATFLPGWRWSEHVKPIANTGSCQAAHTGYFVSGRMKVVMATGKSWSTARGTSPSCNRARRVDRRGRAMRRDRLAGIR
jgi:hypothetical protein